MKQANSLNLYPHRILVISNTQVFRSHNLKGLTSTVRRHSHLLLVLRVLTNFQWNPASTCREIVRKQMLLCIHSASLIRDYNSVLKGPTGTVQLHANLLLELEVLTHFHWIHLGHIKRCCYRENSAEWKAVVCVPLYLLGPVIVFPWFKRIKNINEISYFFPFINVKVPTALGFIFLNVCQ
jgi:hypothetical protein